MRKTRVLFLLLLLVAAAYVGLYGLQSGWFDQTVATDQKSIAQPDSPAPASGDTTEPRPAQQQAEIARPIFDVVRADPSGEMLMAGQAEPGWTVTVRSGEQPIGSAVADADGNWIIQPEKPIVKGDHSLELRAREPDGKRTVFSTQRIALSLSENVTNQPLVAVTEEGKATRVLQGPLQGPGTDQGASAINAAASPQPGVQDKASTQVSFISVDYEEVGEKSVIHLSGYGTPGSPINLFMDDELLGTTKADATGSWTFSSNRELTNAAYDIRADLTEGDSQKVVARAEVKFDRQPSTEVALADEEDEKTLSWREWEKQEEGEVGSVAGVSGEDSLDPENPDFNIIIVRSGDTLWQIAERHYGNGRQFTQIFRSNREQIRNPNLIYPSQKLMLPK